MSKHLDVSVKPMQHPPFPSFTKNDAADASNSENLVCSSTPFGSIKSRSSSTPDLRICVALASHPSTKFSNRITKFLSKTHSLSSNSVANQVYQAVTLDCFSRCKPHGSVSSTSPKFSVLPCVTSPFPIVTSDSTPYSSDKECCGRSRPSVPGNMDPVLSLTMDSSYSVHKDSTSAEVDVDRLQSQLASISKRLTATQDQVDRLLEEKRAWLESHPKELVAAQPTAGELRGRWIQAKTLAETYKQEKESMVVKYAQSEQKRFLLEQRLRALQLHVGQLTKGNATDGSGSPLSFSSEKCELQQKLLQSEKDLALARDQVESLKRSNETSESRIRSLEGRLSLAQENLRLEQKKLTAQNDTVARLNRSLETATKQAKEVERLREREAERLCVEVAYQESQDQLKRLQSDYAQLKEQLHLLDNLKLEILEKDQRLSELTSLTTEVSALRTELDAAKHHELELSEFTRRLTERNANLETENLLSLRRINDAELHLNACKQQVNESASQTDVCYFELKLHNEFLEQQLSHLQRELIRACQSESELRSLLTSEREQAATRRKRDMDRIRDLVRQLARSAQRGTQTNSSSTCAYDLDSAPVCVLSSSSTVEVVQSADSSGSPSVTSKPDSTLVLESETVTINGPQSTSFSQDPLENPNCDRLMVHEHSICIDKIIRLQQNHSELTEKVEFLQDHCHELTEELSKKTKIIQSLLLYGNHLGSTFPSLVNSNHGVVAGTRGLASTPYTAECPDDSHHPDICLHTIQKLQAVLEDVLFKNLTLKNNLNTLGSEVASRNAVIRDFRTKLCTTCAAATDSACEVM